MEISLTQDFYMVAITALLPLMAALLVLQTNPYHALVIRGILGAIAALVYTLFGAADVALTEALVGTMLSITLYAVAVRSSLIMKLGVVQDGSVAQDSSTAIADSSADPDRSSVQQVSSALQPLLKKHHMRLEQSTYLDRPALIAALNAREIHAACVPSELDSANEPSYHLQIRVQRLYDLIQAECSIACPLTYVSLGPTEQAAESAKLSTPVKNPL